jgi:hypothetical protein
LIILIIFGEEYTLWVERNHWSSISCIYRCVFTKIYRVIQL